MKRTKILLALLACIILFAGTLVFALHFSGQSPDKDGIQNPIRLSEVLASNLTYPAPNGKFLDFIEIYNASDSPLDISGYMLSDNGQSIGYTFPGGSIIPARGYLVCWCDKEDDTGNFGSFGISKRGGDQIVLYNSANVKIDEFLVPATHDNAPLVRQEDDSWAVTAQATPGFPNNEDGFESWLRAMGGKTVSVVISEVMSGNGYAFIDNSGRHSDWVELWNQGSSKAELTGCFLSDNPEDRTKWMIPQLTLEPNQRVVIRCAGADATEYDADFALSRSGCSVILTGTMGNTISEVTVPQLGSDCSWALQTDGSYLETMLSTPGYENDQAGYDAWLAAIGCEAPEIVISEVMTANRSTLLSASGKLSDWVELYNAGSVEVDLAGAFLSNDDGDRMKWQIPAMTLAPGQRAVILCAGGNASDGEADFALSRDGGNIILSGVAGNVIDQVEVPRMGADRTWSLRSDGTYEESPYPSPGFDNTEDGCLAYRATQSPLGALIISEVMPSNCRYLRQDDGEFYDWVELKNTSEMVIDLANYSLSDDPGKPGKFPLPHRNIEPGESVVIVCSGYPDLSTDEYPHAPFTLSREESWVYLSRMEDLSCSDYIRVYDVPYQHSVGRVDGENGTFYFTNPTPGTENGSGVAFISGTPILETPDGVYNDVDRVSVVLNGEGNLYYTLDGSVPNRHSHPYTDPITLNYSTVVRVVSIEDGKLPSDVLTAAYIINENHTLPVISIAADPDDLFGSHGIYTNYRQDKEIPANLKLFENGAGFTIDCGIKLYGHTGLQAPKKSFKANFRGRYGASTLDYPVYGEDGPHSYDSLCIRAGQDYPTSIFRDELFTSLCREMTDDVLAQRDKFSILYVNGEYFGIYCMKEAFTEMFYAENMGGAPENVTIAQAPVGASHEIYDIMRYCRKHDLAEDEHYDHVASLIDIDSIIDWMIIEGYSTNGDVQQNLRYFKSTDTGNKWQFAFYDLDWSFYYHNAFKHVLSPHQKWQHLTITRNLMKNAGFREKFLARTSYLMETTLSNEHVLERIDYYENLLDPEVPRERERWNGSYTAWKGKVQYLRDFIVNGDQMGNMVDKLIQYIGLTNAEKEKYFSRWS